MRIRIGTFNTYNLALPGVDYYPDRKHSEGVYKKKTAWIADQLVAMRSEIVGFQEVFHSEALEKALGDHFQPNQIFVENEDDKTRPRCAIATTFPMEAEAIRAFPAAVNFGKSVGVELKEFSRPVVRAKIQVRDDLEFTVFVAHLKSKRPRFLDGEDEDDLKLAAVAQTRSLLIRAAEAAALRCLLIDEMAGNTKPVLVVGDLNDAIRAVSSEVLSGSPPWVGEAFARKKVIWDTLLYNAWDFQTRTSHRNVYYTHLYNGHHEVLDHILVSQELIPQNPRKVGRVEAVRVFNDHLADSSVSPDSTPKWQSDHAQVSAAIKLEDPPAPGGLVAVDPDADRLRY